MTTRDEALEAVIAVRDGIAAQCTMRTQIAEAAMISMAASIVTDKLIAYGIHPNTIKAAFTEEVKTDVDKANKSD